jgi:mannose-6-phosphate isomerase-like protein (cupin superfamily)
LPAVEAIVLRRHEGEEVAMQKRRSVLIKADLEQIGMTETWFGSRQHGAPPHIHRRHVDSFYILDGELTFLTAGDSLHAPASAFCVVPPTVVHGFDHDTDGEVRYLNFHTPGRGFIESLRARRRDRSTYDQTRYDSFDPPADAPLGAAVIGPGEGDRLESATRVATVKVGRDELAFVEFELRAGFEGPRAHIHKHHVDAFYVVAGEPHFRAAGETVHCEPGMLLAAPPGVVHSFSNPGPGPARLVNVHAPSCGFHEYLHVMEDAEGELDEATHAAYDVFEVD